MTDQIDQRRIDACIAACTHIPTEALESGIVHDVINNFGLLAVVLATCLDITGQKKNPAHYVQFDVVLEKFVRPINERLTSGALDKIGPSLDEEPHT